jgi:hypothetical protein
MEGFMRYAVEMGSGAMIIDKGLTQTQSQDGDGISQR